MPVGGFPGRASPRRRDRLMIVHAHGPDQRTPKGWTVKSLLTHMTGIHGMKPETRNLIRLAGLHRDDHAQEER